MRSSYLLFFDLDGTVLYEGKLQDKTRDALIAAKKAGNYLVINTGRSKGTVQKEVLAAIPWDGMICGSVYVQWQGKVLLNHTLSNETLSSVLAYSERANQPLVLEGVENNYSLGCPHYAPGIDGRVEEFLQKENSISKVTFVKKLNPADVPAFPGLRMIFFPRYAEGIAEGYTKKTGMQMLLEKTGIDHSMTAAFGDSENDREMLRFANISVAMKHAPADYDDFIDYRATDAEYGVAEALYKMEFLV